MTKQTLYKRLLIVLGILMTLILILFLVLQTAYVQNIIKDKLLKSLSEQYDANWSIGEVDINFFDEITLNNVVFLDQQGDSLLVVDYLHIDIGLLSLINKSLIIDDIDMDVITSKIYELPNGNMNYQFLLPTATKPNNVIDDNNNTWSFDINSLNCTQLIFYYKDKDQEIKVFNKDLKIDIDAFDFNNQSINIAGVKLDKLKAEITQSNANKTDSTPFSLPNTGWNINLDRLDVLKSNVVFASNDSTYNFKDLDISLKNAYYIADSLALDLNALSGNLKNYLSITSLSGDLKLNGHDLSISDISLLTDRDNINAKSVKIDLQHINISANYVDLFLDGKTLYRFKKYIPKQIEINNNQSLRLTSKDFILNSSMLSTNDINLNYGEVLNIEGKVKVNNYSIPDKIHLDVNLVKSNFNLPNLDRILTDFIIPDSFRQYKQLAISGKAKGNLSNITVENLSLKVDDVVNAQLSGKILNLTDINNLKYDVYIDYLDAVANKLPIPQNEKLAIDSLGNIKFKGLLKGDLYNIIIDGNIITDLGKLEADIVLNIKDSIENLEYNGQLKLIEFDLGTFLKSNEFDIVTLSTNISGKGINMDNLDSRVDGVVSDFSFRGYKYDDIKIDAEFKQGRLNGKLQIDDDHLKLNYNGTIDFSGDQTILDFTADIDSIDLYQLGLYKDSVSLSGLIVSKLKIPLKPNDQGYINLYNINLSNPRQSFKEDSIMIAVKKDQDTTFVDLDSDFMIAQIKGAFKIKEIPSALIKTIGQYYLIDSTFIDSTFTSDHINLNASVKTLQPANIFLPSNLLQSKQVDIQLELDFNTQEIKGGFVVDSFFYKNYFIEKTNLDIKTEKENLLVNLSAKNVNDEKLSFPFLNINNVIADQKIKTTLLARDIDNLPKFKASTLLTNEANQLLIRIQDSIILNNKEWFANDGNEIVFSDTTISINDLRITDNKEFISIQSKGLNNQDIDITFNNFEIGQFTTLLTGEYSKLKGKLNGEASLKSIYSKPFYIVNLQLEQIKYDSSFVGNMVLQADHNPTTGIVSTNIKLKGDENDVIGKGTYNVNSEVVDFDLELDQLELHLLDPFLSEIIKESKGKISGKASLKGPINSLGIQGQVSLEKVITTIVVNNATYGIDQHTIKFDNNTIDIGSFDVFDKNNNVATISGKIFHKALDDIYLDVNVATDEFLFLNTTIQENPVFYGKVLLDANIDITGPPSLLDVNATAKTLENTTITISPFSATANILKEEFITFGKPDDFKDLTNEYLLQLARQYPFKVNILLDANKNAKLNFIVDPITGDKIESKGDGNLRIVLNPDGEQEIYGTYTINEGVYSFSYGDFVSKKFKVKEGGTIRFNGNPLEAILNIDAVYDVYATTYELIKNEISANEAEIAAAKERTNIEVYLTLQGSLSQPQIKLDIQVPKVSSSSLVSTINRKLSDLRNNPNELNNQVFGLLLFNSFILSDNTSTGFDNLGVNIALRSVSGLITSQLNKLASKVIKGVDVNLDVNSYDSKYALGGSGGNVTEVGIDVSKQLFNDRLSVSVGGNYNVEQSAVAGSYSSFVGDFVLEYKLTESGRYRLRVFSKSEYDRILNSNTNKNGVSLFFNNSFDSKTDGK